MNEPTFQGIDVTYKAGADNKDIRNLLVKLVPTAKAQTVEFAKQFKGRTEVETCKKIFSYLCKLHYVADGGEQVIKLPSALIATKTGDCKSYSLLTAGILENLKIPYQFVYASYSSNPIPGHVYVTTQNGCIVDAVYGKFNQEKKATYKYNENMNVRYMAGIDSGVGYCDKNQPARMAGIGSFTPLRTVLLAPGRGIFLGLVKGNRDGMATKLANLQAKNPDKLKKQWEKIGGRWSKLVNAIKVGSAKPAKKLGLLGLIRKKTKQAGGINGIGAVDDAKIQAIIVSACTAIGSAVPGFGSVAGASVGAAMAAIYPTIKDLVAATPAADENDPITAGDPIVPEKDEEGGAPKPPGPPPSGTSFDFSKSLPYIAAAGAAIYFFSKKN
jgi:Transglutaminase-like domain